MSKVIVIKKDFCFEGEPETFIFMPLAEARAYYGAYGFYKNGEEGLEPYTEEDYVQQGTTVYTKADQETADALAEKGKIEDYVMSVAYYEFNGEEIDLQNGYYSDVTSEWIEEYGVGSKDDLAFLGRATEANGISYKNCYTHKNQTENISVLFTQSVNLYTEQEDWFQEPITDEDDIASILKALEA